MPFWPLNPWWRGEPIADLPGWQRGGFPQTAQVESITQAQRLLHEDIIDKALKREMTALFGVRRILDLEHTFLYLCMHDGGLLNITDLSNNLDVKLPTAQHFIELLEACHLIYRLPPFGYGKDMLKGRFKVNLADTAIAPAVMLKSKSIIDDLADLGLARYYSQNVRFTYWRGKQEREVDLVGEIGGKLIPFEVKYQTQLTGASEVKGLIEQCEQKKITRGYVVTKSLDDFGLMTALPQTGETASQIMRLPAPLLCYWMGALELNQSESND